jgi:hypothetical protein
MSESNEVLSQKRPVELRAAPGGTDAARVPILFILVRMAAILLITALVIARFLVAFGVDEFKAHWPRGRTPHTE